MKSLTIKASAAVFVAALSLGAVAIAPASAATTPPRCEQITHRLERVNAHKAPAVARYNKRIDRVQAALTKAQGNSHPRRVTALQTRLTRLAKVKARVTARYNKLQTRAKACQ